MADSTPIPHQQKILETFSEKWKNVECSAHERTSSAACICDSLEDINSDYGYDDIKSFLAQALQETESEGYLRGLRAARGVVPKQEIGNSVFNIGSEFATPRDYKREGHNACRQATLKAIDGLMKENV